MLPSAKAFPVLPDGSAKCILCRISFILSRIPNKDKKIPYPHEYCADASIFSYRKFSAECKIHDIDIIAKKEDDYEKTDHCAE